MLRWLVLPLILVTFVVGGLAMRYLVSSDPIPGFSFGETAATVVGSLLVAVAISSLAAKRRITQALLGGIGEVADAARKVADEDLAELADALAMSDPSMGEMPPLKLDPYGPAELADLASSFQDLHSSIRDVARRQMETLQGGVPSLIVTLARRNAALIDRQLGLLDQLELEERDPEVLGTYYTVDHIGTRVRRNIESLLVLAGEPPPRVWAKSLEMADVVRAAVSEIDEFQRIEIDSLDEAQLAGGAVADITHLLAELMENATQFSPSTHPVKVRSGLDLDTYSITITDRGPGMTNAEIAQLNEILRDPPPLGRVSPATTGILVTSTLARRHGVKIDLIPGIPGLTARVAIPRRLIEVGPAMSSVASPYSTHAEQTSPLGSRRAPGLAQHVIDLTDSSTAAGTDDPVSSPGPTAGESGASRPSVVEGEGAAGIRSALSAFEQGRRAASGVIEGDDGDEEEST